MFKWKNLFAICYRISVFVSLRYYSVDYYLAIFTYIWKIFKFDLFKNLRKHFILYIFDLFFSRKITICTIICIYVWIYRLKIIDTWWLELIQTGFRMNKLKKNFISLINFNNYKIKNYYLKYSRNSYNNLSKLLFQFSSTNLFLLSHAKLKGIIFPEYRGARSRP